MKNSFNNNNKNCIKCNKDFVFYPEETFWNENGSCSTKLVKCPFCNTIQKIAYGKLHNVNMDRRYYK